MGSCLLKSPGFISFGGGLKRRRQIIETTVYYFTVNVLNLIDQICFFVSVHASCFYPVELNFE